MKFQYENDIEESILAVLRTGVKNVRRLKGGRDFCTDVYC